MILIDKLHKNISASQIRIKRSTRARRLALRLDPKARVVNLVVPRGISEARALAFAAEQQDWIAGRLSALPQPIAYEDGAIVPILGRNRVLSITFDPSLKTTSITLHRKELLVFTNKEDPTSRIQRFLRELARDTLTMLCHEKAALIGKKVKTIHIRDTKSRWGSCAPGGRLSFSWRLIHAPYESLDYVAAHEVAHIRHMNHGPRFWALCEELSEDYEGGKGWMRANAQELMRFGA